MSLFFGYSSGLETIEEDIDMQGNRIINLSDPATGSEPVTKAYADIHYSGGGSQSKGDNGDRGSPGSLGSKGDRGSPGARGLKGDRGSP